jgi:hypothetical protein
MLFSYLFGGLAAILAPYQFHITRSMEYTALPALIDHLLRSVFDIRVNLPYFFLFLFVMQVMGPILIFFAALDSPEALVDYSIVAIGLFVLFSRIWSPQWLLWLMPFLILLAKNRKTVALIVGYNLLTYISFPIIFDFYGGSSYPLEISSLLTYFILCAIIFQSLKNLKWRFYFADLKVKKTHLTPLVANQSDLSQ